MASQSITGNFALRFTTNPTCPMSNLKLVGFVVTCAKLPLDDAVHMCSRTLYSEDKF